MISLINETERSSFLRHCGLQPWYIPRYSAELLWLIGTRFSNRIRLLKNIDPHQGLKIIPYWLASQSEMASFNLKDNSLRLPCYPKNSVLDTEIISVPTYEISDPEALLAKHRWMLCAHAAVYRGAHITQAINLVDEWLVNELPHSHVGWEPYSACERLVNLAILLAVDNEQVRYLGHDRVVAFFQSHAKWIDSHLEFYGFRRTNNHILNNARALVIAGAVLSDLTLAKRGLLIFQKMFPRLFDDNGFLRERSSSYQVIVAGWVLDALHFSRLILHSSSKLTETFEYFAHKIICASILLLKALGSSFVHIGDISPDLHPAISLARIRVLYQNYLDVDYEVPLLSQGPWCIAARDEDALVASWPHGGWPENFTTHGHDDLGSFIWRRDKINILVDPGRKSYHGDEISNRQLSSRAHNCLLINGHGPLSPSIVKNGQWFPKPYCKANINVEQVNAFSFKIVHDGFRRLGNVGAHDRNVILTTNGLEVVDTIEGSGIVEIVLYWHFCPGFTSSTNDITTLTNGQIKIILKSITQSGDLPVIHSRSYPFSSAYGIFKNANEISVTYFVSLPCEIRTFMDVLPCVE